MGDRWYRPPGCHMVTPRATPRGTRPYGEDARGRRVAGQGEDDREVSGRRLRRPSVVWAPPRPPEVEARRGRRARVPGGDEVPEDSKRHVSDLKRALKDADNLILATDYDREGEAIAFHVATLLGKDPATAKRVTFTEITRDAILDSFLRPRGIDLKLFDAQEARRILDRLVGYRISPILWRRVRAGLSAGRVQSVAVRLIVERERKIRAFTQVEYWSVDVRLTPEDPDQPFVARLTQVPEGKLAASPDKKGVQLGAEEAAAFHVERLRQAGYRVTNVERKERKRSPAPPFTTSTLQQEAARKLGLAPARR